MPADAEGVVAAEVAEVATELENPRLVHVPHVPLHISFVGAFVGTVGAGELRVPRVHLAAELHVPSQEVLQREDLLAEAAHVAFVDRSGRRTSVARHPRS